MIFFTWHGQDHNIGRDHNFGQDHNICPEDTEVNKKVKTEWMKALETKSFFSSFEEIKPFENTYQIFYGKFCL